MKRFLLIVLLLSSIVAVQADEVKKLKNSIIDQLIVGDNNDKIVGELANKYFPNGENIDQCLRELVAHELPRTKQIEDLLSTITTNGTWPDIEYTSESRSNWDPLRHMQNMMVLARAYKSKSSEYYNDNSVLEAALKALEFWCNAGIQCPNWWYNEIGSPKIIAPLLILLEDEISESLMIKAIEVIDLAKISGTGQNKVWFSGIVFMKALLLNDKELLEASSQAIREELVMAQDGAEGIQSDYSFHQHGSQLQFGNYGLAFAASISYWMRIFNSTSYDFTESQKTDMRNYMLNGITTTVWHGAMDVSCCGRQLFVNSMYGKGASLLISCLNMMYIDKEHRQEYEDYISRNFVAPYANNLTGNIHYDISKYTIHRAADFFFSVKMCSTTIIGGETTNNENLKGYHMSDGATMIYVDGDEYHDIFPIWDSRYIPGTTVALNDKPLKGFSDYSYYNSSDFVGGDSDGMYGVTAMEYRRDGVSADKSWFFFDDVVLCLGCNIASEEDDSLVTTLNQANFKGSANYLTATNEVCDVVNGADYIKATKLLSDNVGYESLDGQEIELRVKEQVGTWNDVAHFYSIEEVKGDVFMARIVHNSSKGGSYAYAVTPKVESSDFYSRNPLTNNYKVIQNDSQATIVESKKDNIIMAVFWQECSNPKGFFSNHEKIEPSVAIAKLDPNGECKIQFTPLKR